MARTNTNTGGGGGGGTVTSVGLTMPTGFTVANSPVTSAGTLAVSMQTGYVIPTQALLDTFLTNITDYILPGIGVTLVGMGTFASPYTINVNGVTGAPTEVAYYDATTGAITSDSNFTRANNNNGATRISTPTVSGITADFRVNLSNISSEFSNSTSDIRNTLLLGTGGTSLVVSDFDTSDWISQFISNQSSWQALFRDLSTNIQARVRLTASYADLIFSDPTQTSSGRFVIQGNSTAMLMADSATGDTMIIGCSAQEMSVLYNNFNYFAIQPDFGMYYWGDIDSQYNNTTIIIRDVDEVYNFNKLASSGPFNSYVMTDVNGDLFTNTSYVYIGSTEAPALSGSSTLANLAGITGKIQVFVSVVVSSITAGALDVTVEYEDAILGTQVVPLALYGELSSSSTITAPGRYVFQAYIAVTDPIVQSNLTVDATFTGSSISYGSWVGALWVDF